MISTTFDSPANWETFNNYEKQKLEINRVFHYMNKLFAALVIILTTVLFSQVFLVSAVEFGGYWVSKTSKPTPGLFDGGCVTASNGMIYTISGDGTNEMYDPITDTWTTKTSMPTSRWAFGITSYQNKIYVIGGCSRNYEGVLKDALGVNEVYDIVTDTWETKTPMPTHRGGLCTEVVAGKIYAIGGFEPIDNWFNFDWEDLPPTNEVYDIATDTWSSKTPFYRDLLGSVVIDNKIYVITHMYSLAIYDTKTDIWSLGDTIPFYVRSMVGATTGELAPKRLYVIGGYYNLIDDGQADFNIQVYDPESDIWTTEASMLTDRYSTMITVVDDYLYVIGGVDTSSDRNPVNTVEMYVPSGHKNADQYPNSVPITNAVLIVAVAVVITIGAAIAIALFFYTKNLSSITEPPKQNC